MGEDKVTSDVSVTRKGVTRRIRARLWQYPHSSAVQVCKDLNLPYEKYQNMVRNQKSILKKILNNRTDGRLHSAQKIPFDVTHRQEWVSAERLPLGIVEAVRFEAMKRKPRKDEVKPVGEWYVAPNRNKVMIFVNKFVQIRVWQGGTLRVLPRQKMDFDSLKGEVQSAFFRCGLDIPDCERISEDVEPGNRHRVFMIGDVSPFKIEHYKKSLGATLLADGSHPRHLEVIEEWPSWIPPLLNAFSSQTQIVSRLADQISLHLSVLEGIKDVNAEQKTVTVNLAEAVEKLVDVISTLDRQLALHGRKNFPWEV